MIKKKSIAAPKNAAGIEIASHQTHPQGLVNNQNADGVMIGHWSKKNTRRK
jgi:hypothetical protein